MNVFTTKNVHLKDAFWTTFSVVFSSAAAIDTKANHAHNPAMLNHAHCGYFGVQHGPTYVPHKL